MITWQRTWAVSVYASLLATVLVSPARAAEMSNAQRSAPASQSRPHLGPAEVPTLTPLDLPRLPEDHGLTDRQRAIAVPRGLKLMVFAPHPDDETLGGAGLIRRVLEGGGDVRVVFITNGDGFLAGVRRTTVKAHVSKDDFLAYGRRRHAEAIEAVRQLGLAADKAIFLGFPDGGIDDLWDAHWSPSDPYTSPFTDVDHSPYTDGSRRLEYDGKDLAAAIDAALRDFAPQWVLLPDPRDHHDDHSTTGIFVLQGLEALRERNITAFQHVDLFTYLVHYPDYPGTSQWISHVSAAGILGSHIGLPALSKIDWLHIALSPEELAAKNRALSSYQSQLHVMESFLHLFVRKEEIFGHLRGGDLGALANEYAARFHKRHN